ncbi:MAG: tetratricopeptide repeat protein [Candidatus Omnitrophica bacterium]|nr:tetratricopeptide repeat protein [Candidatus Omnitrophota bacterium]
MVLCLTLSACARFFPKGPDRFYFGSYSEAEVAYNQGNYQEAVDKYSAYVAENPEGNLAVIAQYYMARSYANLGQTDKARERYNQIIEKHPDLVWAKFSEGQLQELQVEKKTLSSSPQ